MTCACGRPATHSYLMRVGKPPENPKHHGTQNDLQALEVVPVCDFCRPVPGPNLRPYKEALEKAVERIAEKTGIPKEYLL